MYYGKVHTYITDIIFIMNCCTAAVDELGVAKFRAKILETNTASLQLFNKLDFVEVIFLVCIS